MSLDVLLSRLDNVHESKPGMWRARCPVHKGKSRSLVITEDSGEIILIHCFAGCGGADVLDAFDMCYSDLYPKISQGNKFFQDRIPHLSYRSKLAQLEHCATVIQIAAERIVADEPITDEDKEDIQSAYEAIVGVTQ